MVLTRPVFTLYSHAQRLCRRLPLAAFLLLFSVFFTTSPVFTAHASGGKRLVADELSLKAVGNQFFVNIPLGVDDDEWLMLLLKDGAVIELGVELSIERRRSWWSNSVLASATHTFTMRYDQLTREFQMFHGNAANPVRERNIRKLLSDTWAKLSLPLVSLQAVAEHGEGQVFLVTVDITLQHGQTPPWLANSGLFWSSEIAPPLTLTLEYHTR